MDFPELGEGDEEALHSERQTSDAAKPKDKQSKAPHRAQ
jgi:hypothetical protein